MLLLARQVTESQAPTRNRCSQTSTVQQSGAVLVVLRALRQRRANVPMPIDNPCPDTAESRAYAAQQTAAPPRSTPPLVLLAPGARQGARGMPSTNSQQKTQASQPSRKQPDGNRNAAGAFPCAQIPKTRYAFPSSPRVLISCFSISSFKKLGVGARLGLVVLCLVMDFSMGVRGIRGIRFESVKSPVRIRANPLQRIPEVLSACKQETYIDDR